MTFWVIAFVAAVAAIVLGQMQARRTGGLDRKWAGVMAAFGLVVMTVGSVLFEGMESLYIWIVGMALFFIIRKYVRIRARTHARS